MEILLQRLAMNFNRHAVGNQQVETRMTLFQKPTITLPLFLRTAFKDAASGTANIPQQMAAVTMVSIPLFLVFIFLRKYIMKGVSRSGIKG